MKVTYLKIQRTILARLHFSNGRLIEKLKITNNTQIKPKIQLVWHYFLKLIISDSSIHLPSLYQPLMTKAPNVSTAEMLIFEKGISAIFKIYDTDRSGELDHGELRIMIDDCRASMYLPNCDEDIFVRIVNIIDADHDGNITLEELIRHLHRVYGIIQEPGKTLESEIK